jgi:undecaprenyl-diphosphatase
MNGLEGFDNAATAFINGLSGDPTQNAIAIAVTKYGAFVIVAAVAIRWWWYGADKDRERYLAVVSGASVTLGLALNQAVLLLVHRVRPYDAGVTHLLISPSADPSFPSDHATLGFAIALAMLGAGARRGWAFLVAALILAASRIYVGTHYLSDVLGGALTGTVAANLCLSFLRQGSALIRLASRVL